MPGLARIDEVSPRRHRGGEAREGPAHQGVVGEELVEPRDDSEGRLRLDRRQRPGECPFGVEDADTTLVSEQDE